MTESTLTELDHAFLHLSDPAPAYRLLTEGLGLPRAWPLVRHGPILSGGVILGNANLELLRFSLLVRLLRQHPAVGGLAFATSPLAKATSMASERGFQLRRTRPITREAGPNDAGTSWTGAFLRPWPGATVPYLCDYTHDTKQRREEFANRLASADGGLIGLIGVERIILSTRNAASETNAWARLLGLNAGPHGWSFTAGIPTIEIREAPGVGMTLVLTVSSESRAADAACKAGMEIRHDDRPIALHGSLGRCQLAFSGTL